MMKQVKKVCVIFLILVPLILAAFIPTAAQAFTLSNAMQQSEIAHRIGNRDNEVKALQTLLEYQPWRYDAWAQLGGLQYALGRYQEAIDAFQTVQKAGKLTAANELEFGKCWLALEKTDQARDAFRRASDLHSQDVDFLIELSEVQETINDSYGVLATLLQAHGLEPQNHHINYDLGVQFASSQPENAIFFLDDAAKDATYQQASNILINFISNTKSLGEVAERYIYIGQQLSLLGEWESASSAFKKATTLDPQNAIAWALEGEAVQHVNGDGYPFLTKALELDPHSDIVNGLMALYFRRQLKLDMALTYLYSAAENNPNESTWQIEIGSTLALQGNLVDALTHYKMATMMDPNNWGTWKQLAAFCVTYDYNVDTDGLEAARKALLLYPGSPVLLDLMGSVYMIMDDLDNAERFYFQALQAAPNQAEILYHLGQLYLAKGDKGKALDYLQQAAMYATDNRIRENANRLIKTNGG
jgi:Flp pilus assembly protein TadD